MGSPCNENYARLLVTPDLHQRVKVFAAKSGKSVVAVAGELLTPALDRAERDLSRMKGEGPDRDSPID